MGTIRTSESVKLIMGLLAARGSLFPELKVTLQERYGTIDAESEQIAFDFTDYYCGEMGSSILRQYISFERLIAPDSLADIKLSTNECELIYAADVSRQANIDPGYISLDKLVLATTKNARHRVYIGKGIYAESTLYFTKGSYTVWEWTYPDYRLERTIDFFNRVRRQYKKQLSEA